MCGIAGVISITGENLGPEFNDRLKTALAMINHRGPDNVGQLDLGHVKLGHVRLSILDLGPSANQPFCKNPDYTLCYNGEIYNYIELKKELSNLKWSSSSDTEVVYEMLSDNTELVARFNGMYAFAFYDSKSKKLTLARDKYGIKPLYYYKDENILAFCSEMKGLNELIQFNGLDYQGIAEWSTFGNPLGHNTYYKNIKSMLPGHMMTVFEQNVEIKKYYDSIKIANDKPSKTITQDKLSTLLVGAVNRQMRADVPMGVFLSGGIDSSAILTIAATNSDKKLTAFTAEFDYANNTQDVHLSKKLCADLNVEHEVLRVTSEGLPETITEIVTQFDGPFADAACIPLFKMSKMVRGSVKVVLQGDGGDELFAGYKRYRTIDKYGSLLDSPVFRAGLHQSSKWLKFSARPSINRIIRYLEAMSKDKEYSRFASLLSMDCTKSNTAELLNLPIQNLDAAMRYKQLGKDTALIEEQTKRLLLTDFSIILPDTFFQKVDMATMAGSIEVRVPFLDDELVNFALSASATDLMGGNSQQKFLLRKTLSTFLPDYIINAPKKGFSVPYQNWLKHDLQQFFLDLLHSCTSADFLNVKKVELMYKMHCNGKGNYGYVLWKVLMFMVWRNSKLGKLC